MSLSNRATDKLPAYASDGDVDSCNVERFYTETTALNTEMDKPTDREQHNTSKTPIDHGWAWVILVASTCEMFIIIGMMRCYGIFFLEFQQKFNSTSSVTSLISTLQNVAYSISGLFVMTVGLRFVSSRKCIVFGGLLTGLGYIITAVLQDVTAVLFINGAFVGLSLSFVYGPMVSTLNSYFERHLGLANSISNSGVSLGGLVLAPLFTYLFKEYGYRGAFLIAAGLYFNTIAFGLLLRPVEFYLKRKENKDTKANDDTETESKVNSFKEQNNDEMRNYRPDNHPFEGQDTVKNGRLDAELETMAFLENEGTRLPMALKRVGRNEVERQQSSKSISSVETGERLFETSVMKHAGADFHTSLHSLYNSMKDLQDENQKKNIHDGVGLRKLLISGNIRKLVGTIFDFSILKDSLFWYYLLCTVFLCSGNASTPFYVAPLANEIGMNAEKTAVVLMVVNVVDLIARISIGFISDRNWLRRSNLIVLTSGILGVACCLVHFVNCFVSLVIFSVVVGLLQGVYWSLFAVVIVDYLTLEKLKSALGFTGLVQGLSIGCAIPIAGYLKDATDTYVTSYIFIGGLLLTGAGFTALLPFVQRCLLRHADKTVHR